MDFILILLVLIGLSLLGIAGLFYLLQDEVGDVVVGETYKPSEVSSEMRSRELD